jgi:Mur ligase, glutamate ligase domain
MHRPKLWTRVSELRDPYRWIRSYRRVRRGLTPVLNLLATRYRRSIARRPRIVVVTLAEIPARRRIVVLGDVSEPVGSMGPIYRRLGERIGNVAARAIFVTRNATGYSAGAKRAGMTEASVVRVGRSVRAAVEALKRDLRPDDVVLIKGRDTQCLARVALALMGRTVRCERQFCRLRIPCDECHLLAVGSNRPL